ncbi:MAG: hypothetical protein WCY65_04975 [Candidatus Methanomethylophilaceae archaeon]
MFRDNHNHRWEDALEMPENQETLDLQGRCKLDHRIRRALVVIVPICILTSLLLMVFNPPDRMGTVLVQICLPYVPAFSLMGIYVMLMMRNNKRKRNRRVIAWSLFFTALATVLVMLYNAHVRSIAHVVILSLSGNTFLDMGLIFLQLLFAFAVVVTAGFGVLGVIVAYFRYYMVRILRSLEHVRNDGSDRGRMKGNIWVFDIPAVIDIEGVELEPVYCHGGFPKDSFRSMVAATLLFSIILVSYIFLNPFFLMEIEAWEMVIVGMILTFFVPVFVVPWSITRDLGAKIKSQAKDYYIWNGMKKRLYQSFMALGVVFLMVGLVLYLVDDLVMVAFIYMGYFLFSICLSIIYSFIYFNYFQRDFRDDIVLKFNQDSEDLESCSIEQV